MIDIDNINDLGLSAKNKAQKRDRVGINTNTRHDDVKEALVLQ